jgi:uncharacterized protein YjbJ (UPF0337 family)
MRMGETKNKVVGAVKEAAGKVTGDPDMEARGKGQKTVGKVQGDGRKVNGAIEEAIGKVRVAPPGAPNAALAGPSPGST